MRKIEFVSATYCHTYSIIKFIKKSGTKKKNLSLSGDGSGLAGVLSHKGINHGRLPHIRIAYHPHRYVLLRMVPYNVADYYICIDMYFIITINPLKTL
jgi:hypothetical protein